MCRMSEDVIIVSIIGYRMWGRGTCSKEFIYQQVPLMLCMFGLSLSTFKVLLLYPKNAWKLENDKSCPFKDLRRKLEQEAKEGKQWN